MSKQGRLLYVRYVPCKRTCPGGNDCCLNGGIRHHYHGCKNEACMCHSQARFEVLSFAGIPAQRTIKATIVATVVRPEFHVDYEEVA